MKLLPTGCTLEEIIENAKMFALKTLGAVIFSAFGIIIGIIGFQDGVSFEKKLLNVIVVLVIISISFIILSFLFAIAFQWIKVACYKIKQLEKNAVIPTDYSFSDIKPFIIEESETIRKYLYNNEKQTFDVEQTLYFKIQGGVESRKFITFTYNEESVKNNEKVQFDFEKLAPEDYTTPKLNKTISLGSTKTVYGKNCNIKIQFDNFELKSNDMIEFKIKMHIKGIKKDWIINGEEYSKSGGIGYKRMKIKYIFPENISIKNADCDVVSFGMNAPIIKEKEKIKTDFYDKNSNNIIEMEVNNPIVGLEYQLKYDSLEII